MSLLRADFETVRHQGIPLDFVTKIYLAGTPPYCTIGAISF